MQHEWIGFCPEFGDDKRDALRHQPGDEGNVSGEAIELGDNHRTLVATRDGKAAAS